MLKLLDYPIVKTPVLEMKDGEIAEIIQWGGVPGYEGRIVQRYKNGLISLGRKSEAAWPNLFEPSSTSAVQGNGFLVRILPSGATLKLTG